MRKWTVAAIVFLFSQNVLLGQRGTAERGYYPLGYRGSTFTGTVTSTNDDTREITLKYTDPKKGKAEIFVGVLEEGYTLEGKDGTLHQLKPSKIRPGARIKVYYMRKKKRLAGRKTTVNEIFLIAGSRNLRGRLTRFMAFGGSQ